jgi:CRP-like cAMP-binding protein
VAGLLLELFHRLRRRPPLPGGEAMALPLTQIHIADALGLTPVHVNRTLRALRGLGVIEYGGGVFRLLAPASLYTLAEMQPETQPRGGLRHWATKSQ